MFPKRYFPDAYFGPRYWDKAAGGGTTPVADFIGTPVFGNAPLTVIFTDLSKNTPTSWLLNFGDGTTSTLQNPQHTYDFAGTYTVSLTATNASGSDTKTKSNYVTVAAPVPPGPERTEPGTGGLRRARQKARQKRNENAAKRRREIDIAVAVMLLEDDS